VPIETVVRRITQTRKIGKEDLRQEGDIPVFDQSELGLLGYATGTGFLGASIADPVVYFGDHTCKLRISSRPFFVGPNTIPFVGKEIPSIVLYCALQGVQQHEEYKRHWQGLIKKQLTFPTLEECERFAKDHSPLLGVLEKSASQNELLAATRNSLLTGLLTGNLHVAADVRTHMSVVGAS
jgi:type I restriction enzyme S subunit